MKDDKVNEIARGQADTEGELRRLVPSSVPPGMRRRVLDRALDSRKNAAVTPRLRSAALVWAVLALVAVIGDAVISKGQSERLAAFLGGPGISTPAGAEEEGRRLWAEVGGDLGDLDKLRMTGIVLSRLGSRHESRWASFEARDRLKGMIDHEDPENYY